MKPYYILDLGYVLAMMNRRARYYFKRMWTHLEDYGNVLVCTYIDLQGNERSVRLKRPWKLARHEIAACFEEAIRREILFRQFEP